MEAFTAEGFHALLRKYWQQRLGKGAGRDGAAPRPPKPKDEAPGDDPGASFRAGMQGDFGGV